MEAKGRGFSSQVFKTNDFKIKMDFNKQALPSTSNSGDVEEQQEMVEGCCDQEFPLNTLGAVTRCHNIRIDIGENRSPKLNAMSGLAFPGPSSFERKFNTMYQSSKS